jgi:hypothetical protein
MGKISWTDRVRNEEVLHRVIEERNVLHTIKWSKANGIGHILRRLCLLKHYSRKDRMDHRNDGKTRVKQLLQGLKTKGYWKLREEAL